MILNCQYYIGRLPIKFAFGQGKLNCLFKMKCSNKKLGLFYVLFNRDNELLLECVKHNLSAPTDNKSVT